MKKEKDKLVGLTNEEVKQSQQDYGRNIIEEAKPPTFWEKYKESFEDAMIKLLLAIAGIFVVMYLFGYGGISDVLGIVLSVLIVTIISTKTVMASANKFKELKDSIKKPTCKVLRNGKVEELSNEELVVGDLVILQSGDGIYADGIIIDGDLKVNNSVINGETEECKKTAISDELNYDRNVAVTGDTYVDKYSVFSGTNVTDGTGVMKVTKVGMETQMGLMRKDMQSEEVDSPLKVKLTDLANKISKFGYIGAVVIGVVMFLTTVTRSGDISAYMNSGFVNIIHDVLEALMVAVVIVVMAVPEGLPLMIAMVLMQNTSKLLGNNVLVRKPIGIETAGSLNILFSDKTGTITKGHLQVVEFFDGQIKDTFKTSNKIKELVIKSIGKNTGAMYDENGNIIGGNATDKALLSFLSKKDVENISDVDVLKAQQFNSANKYSCAQLSNMTVYKGAPEVLMSKATKMITENGEIVELDRDTINDKIDKLANKAMRVLSFAYSESGLVENTLPEDLIMIGFVGIRDDVRPEAKSAIKEVQKAGIQVVMITGDRKETAVAIAKESNLITKETDIALTSKELNDMSDDEVKAILPNIRVIARALPMDKSRMVRISQELGLVCGMTGDGVNDAPALKRADVGFAMGSGTDVAKEAGDIIILDDNFKSIEKAILYGRTIYNNILKFIKFQLTINVSAVAICTIAPLAGIAQPLTVPQILLINLIMDGLGALALGGEPALEKYMQEKPKSRTQALVSKDMFKQILFAGAWVTILGLVVLFVPQVKELFSSEESNLTAFFAMFVLTAVFNGFNVRSEDIHILEHIKDNKGFLKVMASIVVILVILTFVGGDLFKVVPLNLKEWGIITLLSLSIIPFDLMRKIITKSK